MPAIDADSRRQSPALLRLYGNQALEILISKLSNLDTVAYDKKALPSHIVIDGVGNLVMVAVFSLIVGVSVAFSWKC